jgi:stage V sporulation protein B
MYLTAEELGKKRPQNVTWILSGCILYSLAFSISVSCLLSYFAPFIARSWIGDPRTVDALRLFAAFLPVCCLTAVMTGYFTAANRIGTLAAVEVAEQALSMGITVGMLAIWAGNEPHRACLCVIFGSSLGSAMTLLTLIYLRLRERPVTGARIPVAARLRETALPLAIADDLKTGITTAENLMVPKRLVLNRMVSDPLAAFGMVTGMVFPVIMFPAAILFGLTELLIPELARCAAAGNQRRILYLKEKSLRFAMVYGLSFSGLIFLNANDLCLTLYKSNDATRQLQLYSLLIPMLYCDAITDAMVKGLGQQKICVRYNILTSAMDVIFLYLLLPRYGMEGYFFSFFVTHLINFLLSIRRLGKIAQQSIPFWIPLMAAASAIFSICAASYVPTPIPRSIGFLLILGNCLYLCHIVTRADIRWIQSLIWKKTSPVR